MTTLTVVHKELNNHIVHTKGTKTVCVSTCLSYLGIPSNSYSYTSSHKNVTAYHNVLRKNGYSVRSRITEFKVKKHETTMTQLKANIRKSSYTEKDLFLVSGVQSRCAHLMILNGKGETIIDTAPTKKWRIRAVYIVEKNS